MNMGRLFTAAAIIAGTAKERCNMMRNIAAVGTIVAFLGASALGDYIDHDFDTGFTGGGTALAGQNDWAGDATVLVTTDSTDGETDEAVSMPAGTAVSNNIAQSPAKAWSEFRILPAFGVQPSGTPATNDASCLFYFTAEGFLAIYNADIGDWQTCDTNVWGAAVTSLTNTPNEMAEIAVYQNFTAEEAVFFVNGVVVAQDIPFPDPGDDGNYNHVRFQNQDNTALIDDVRVQTSYDNLRLAANTDGNGLNGLSDAAEADAYGYVGRTLYVDTTGDPAPHFATIADAVAVARDLDVISIDASYAGTTEAITVDNNAGELTHLRFTGAGYTIASLILNDGVDVTFNGNVQVTGDLTASGASTIALASGVALDVDGVLALNDGGASVTVASSGSLTAGDLNMVSDSSVAVTSGDFSGETAEITMTGTFTIDGGDWGSATLVAQDLTHEEFFNTYADQQKVNKLLPFGWGASSDDVVVQKAAYNAANDTGIGAIYLPNGTTASNLVNGAGHNKVWTDYYLRPASGVSPSDTPETDGRSFISYVDTNENLVVWNGSAWYPLVNNVSQGTASTLSSDSFTRVTIFQNFTDKEAAVFIGGTLAAQMVPFPDDVDVNVYSSLAIHNQDGEAYLDTVTIRSDTFPTGLTDNDNDGTNDGEEIQNYGRVDVPGTLFKFS